MLIIWSLSSYIPSSVIVVNWITLKRYQALILGTWHCYLIWEQRSLHMCSSTQIQEELFNFPLWFLNALTYTQLWGSQGEILTDTEEDEAVWSHAMKREAERSKKQEYPEPEGRAGWWHPDFVSEKLTLDFWSPVNSENSFVLSRPQSSVILLLQQPQETHRIMLPIPKYLNTLYIQKLFVFV